jgi:acetylornithine/succinyldiaminopimelate/putrescine aminotransferase
VGCEPTCDYEVVFKKDVTSKGYMIGLCSNDNKIATDLLKAADKKKIKYDGVLIGNSKNDMVIKFTPLQ